MTHQSIELSALDHMCTQNAGPIELVFHYRAKLDAQRVVDAFHATAGEFIGMAGRVVQVDAHNLAFDLSRDAAEIRVVTEAAAVPLSACVDSVELRLGAALARARITQLGDQGSAVGLSMSHAVADGYGFFLFIAAWAARARGQDFPQPNCSRTALSNPGARSAKVAAPPSRDSLRQAGLVVLDEPVSAKPFRTEERRLPADWIDEHKRLAAEHKLSFNDVLCAALWKDALQDSSAETVMLACPVDLRRHQPALGPLFFGNADLHASLELTPRELRELSIPELGQRIRDQIRALPNHIDAAIEELERFRAAHGLAILPRVYVYPPERGLLVSNMSRIPLEPLDFGAGAPERLERSAWRPSARTCFLLPGAGEAKLVISQP
jgi:Transferase family